MRSALSILALAASVAAPSLSAQAATMTFDNLTDPFATSYLENGITATADGDMGMYSSGTLHIDDGGTSAPSTVTFSMAKAFSALSFDLLPLGFYLALCDDESGGCTSPTFPNVRVEGFSGASLVSSLLFDMGAGNTPRNVTLGSTFRNLTSMTISIVYPIALLNNPPAGMTAMCDAPCSHFELDNVTLAPVPLPAGLPLAASGLVALGAMALRRRKRA